MAGGLMQLVAYGAQDVYLTVILRLPSGKLHTVVTQILRWNRLSKLSMARLILDVE